jgi:hypothetical protein
MSPASVTFDPAPLELAIVRGFEMSLPAVAAAAAAQSGSRDATAEVIPTGAGTAELKATGRIGAIREEGARPHEIEPGVKGYLYIGGGKFVSGTISHPGSPPIHYLEPAAREWAQGGCQIALRESLASSGF